MPSGIILKGIGGFYYVKSDGQVYACRARGVFRKKGITPLPGDKVDFSITDPKQNEGLLQRIHDRRNCLERPAVSNVNMMLAVVSVCKPGPDFELLDKLLVTAALVDMEAVICVNKVDLDDRSIFKEIRSEYTPAGYSVIAASGLTGTGIDEISEVLSGNITVLAGQSGVGKSTLINKIAGMDIMDTGEISRAIGRGRHTTRHAQLVEIETGGYIVDTPGFSSFELKEVDPGTLQHYYNEFTCYMAGCRFKGCCHISEPGCAVREAVGKGLVSERRYNRYSDLYKKLESERRRLYD